MLSPAQSGNAMVTTKSMTTTTTTTRTTTMVMMMSPPRRGRGQRRRRRLHDKNTTAVVKAAAKTNDDDENENDETPTSGVVEVNETAIHYFKEDAFYDRAEELYSAFQNNHSDAKRTNSERFCWDYWHVENQYTQLRTPAREYFLQQKKTTTTTEEECCCYEKFEEALLKYARENLALSNFTPIWMSCYVDGMGQELHADVPHGPLAFVFSLTKNFDLDDDGGRGIYFRGGETTILRPERANYWQRFDPTEIVERTQLFEEIEPKFNRLTIFDPRLPHGVREVKGTKDVSKGRLVLNGWFNEPAISCQGGLTLEDVGKVLDAKLDALYEELENLPAMTGFAALRMEIDADTGNVESISWGCDTVAPAVSLHDPDEITETRDAVLATIAGMMSECVFPSSKTRSSICVPFVFA